MGTTLSLPNLVRAQVRSAREAAFDFGPVREDHQRIMEAMSAARMEGEARRFSRFGLQEFAGMAPGPNGTGGKNQLLPFRPNTRQRMRLAGGPIPITAFNTALQPLTFPQIGLLSGIYLFVAASVSDAASSPAATLNAFKSGPFNLTKRITGALNLGTNNVYDVSGYGLYGVNKVQAINSDQALFQQGTSAIPGYANTDEYFQYPLTGSLTQNVAAAFTYVLYIPVSVNDHEQFHLGLLNLQAPEVRKTLSISTGQLSDVYTTSDAITLGGNIYPYMEYFEVPNPQAVALPPRIMHRLLEDRTPILNTGDTTYLTPRQGYLLQALQTISLNGAITKSGGVPGNIGTPLGTPDMQQQRVVFNKTDTPYQNDFILQRALARMRYGSGAGLANDLPAGTFIWDFFNAKGLPTRGDLRDVIDTESLSTLELITTISAGATLGSGNNFIDTVRRITQSY